MVSFYKLLAAAATVWTTAAAPTSFLTTAGETAAESDLASRDLTGAKIGTATNLVKLTLAFSAPPSFLRIDTDLFKAFNDITGDLFNEFDMDIGSWLAGNADSAWAVWNAAVTGSFNNAVSHGMELEAAGASAVNFLYEVDLHLAGTYANAVYQQALVTGLTRWASAVGITASSGPLTKRDLDAQKRDDVVASGLVKRAGTCPAKQPYGPGIYKYASGTPKLLSKAPSQALCAFKK